MTELWLVDLDRSAVVLEAMARELPRLTVHDRNIAATIKDVRARRRRLAAWTVVRLLLERTAGPDVRGQPIVRTLRGKPVLADGAAKFSLSHVDGLALVGVTKSAEIGVDLEKLRPVRIIQSRRECIIAAAAGLAGQEPAAAFCDHAFLQAWCRIEAYAKAQGEGLGVTLAELGLRDAKHPRASVEIAIAASGRARAAGLRVKDIALPQGLFGAIALSRGAMPPGVAAFPTQRAELERWVAPVAGKSRLASTR